MLYAIISEDTENSLPLRQNARPKHLARLEDLKIRVVICSGPNPSIDCDKTSNAGFTGSLVIAEFESLEAAID